MRLLSLLATLFISFSLHAETFTFTAIPDQDESQLQARFGKFADYLSQELGIDVKYVPVKSYAAAVTAFRNNQVQLAWFGGLSGVQARHLVPGSQAIAQGYEDQFFETYFIAHKSSALEASEELPKALANLTFTFGSKGSTSGRLMPEHYNRQAFQQAPEEVFSRIGFSGNHSRTIALVQSGAYQVGAVNYKVWESELAAGTINTNDVQVIWKTPAYQDYQWSIRGDVDQRWGEGFTAKITQTLLDISDKDLLASFPRESFIKATNSDYQAIEDIAVAIDLMTE